MSFDIYGNHLRRGYCEVHPDVHEEYPCSQCIEDNQPQPSYPEPSIKDLFGECGNQLPTDPTTTCAINNKPCLLEENLPCTYLEEKQ